MQPEPIVAIVENLAGESDDGAPGPNFDRQLCKMAYVCGGTLAR